MRYRTCDGEIGTLTEYILNVKTTARPRALQLAKFGLLNPQVGSFRASQLNYLTVASGFRIQTYYIPFKPILAAMANLLPSMPPDISEKVLGYLDQSSLYSLLRCSKAYRDLSLMALYSDITLYDCRWSSIHARMNSSVYFLHRLACRLLNDERLRSQVRRFTIRHATRTMVFPQNHDTQLAEAQFDQKLHELVCRARNSRRMYKELKLKLDADHELLLAILLPALPRLEYLEMDFVPKFTHMMWRAINNKGFPKDDQRPFQSLREVTCLSSRHFQEGMVEQALGIFLRLPTLERLNGVIPHDPNYTQSDGYLKMMSSTVTRVCLTGIRRAPDHLYDMLAALKCLKSLELVWAELSLIREDPDVLDESDLLEALLNSLSQLAPTLETLSLYYESLRISSSYPYRPLLPFLVQFTRLSQLKLGMLFALGLSHQVFEDRFWTQADTTESFNTMHSSQFVHALQGILPPNVTKIHLIRSKGHKMAMLLHCLEHVITLARENFSKLESVCVEDVEGGRLASLCLNRKEIGVNGNIDGLGKLQQLVQEYRLQLL